MRSLSTRTASARTASTRVILLRVAFTRIADRFLAQRARVSGRCSPSINLATVLAKTLSADAAMILAGWLLSALSIQVVGTLFVPYQRAAALLPPEWFVLVSCLLFPCMWLLGDLTKALSYPQALPFAGLRTALAKSYQQRLYLLLLSFCFVASLTLLCMVATKLLLIWKLILSGAFVSAFHCLNQRHNHSVNRSRLAHRDRLLMSGLLTSSILTTGALLLGLLLTNQAIVIARLAASFLSFF